MAEARLIPIHSGGSWTTPGPVVAFAVVDAADFPELSSYRWHLNPKGYAVRTTNPPTPPVCPECGWTPPPRVHQAHSVASHRGKMHHVPREPRHTVAMHRQVAGLGLGDVRQADHQDRNRLNNRRGNLRIVDASVQAQNQKGLRVFRGKPTESAYRGVNKVKKNGVWTGKWKAVVAGKYRGIFDTEEAAAAAAAEVRRAVMPYAVD